jgi:hypothetical protein
MKNLASRKYWDTQCWGAGLLDRRATTNFFSRWLLGRWRDLFLSQGFL